ncbi:MAG: CHAD domain-containing protein [Planctomycetes bacterium]|nr:CHAD domain-containing protein [Planctomycetota bacterium]
MTGTDRIEREIKLASDAPLDAARIGRIATTLGIAPGRPTRVHHTDVYFDDLELTLARAGCGLRLRRENGIACLSLKTELGADGDVRERREIEVRVEDDSREPSCVRDLPAALRRSLAARVALQRVGPVARLDTVRTCWSFGDGGGAVELALDEVTVLADDGRIAGVFCECEIEAGSRRGVAMARRLAAALRAELGLRDAEGNKLTRALALLGTLLADDGEPTPLRADVPGDDAARELLLRHFAAMRREEQRVIASGSIAAVHALRVACRHGRATLRHFAGCLPPDQEDLLRGTFKDTAHACAALRELDVLLDDLKADRESLPDVLLDDARAIRRHVAHSRARLMCDARAALARPKRRARLARVEEILSARRTGERATVREFAPRCLHAAADRVIAAIAPGVRRLDDDAIHELRLALRELRHAAEDFVDVYGKDLSRFAERLARLVDLTGRHSDAIDATRRLLGLSAKAHGLRRKQLPVLGCLAALAVHRADRARLEIDAARTDLADDELRALLAAILRSPRS